MNDDLLDVGDDQQLRIGLVEVGVRALVLPGEEALLPDIRTALAAALLAGAGLEGQSAVAILAGVS
jgi:hypothetical protein